MSDTPIYDQLGAEPEVPNANFYLADNPDAPVPVTQEQDIAPDPFAGSAGISPAATLPEAATQPESVSDGEKTSEPVVSYQVTIKTANPENPASHSLVTTREMTRDELLMWAGTLQF